MNAPAQLFWPCAAQDCRAVTGQQNRRQPQRRGCAGGKHGRLCAGINERVNLVAIELHRKEQMVTLRSAGGHRDIGLGPGRRGPGARLPAVERYSVIRQVEVYIEAIQTVGSEDAV